MSNYVFKGWCISKSTYRMVFNVTRISKTVVFNYVKMVNNSTKIKITVLVREFHSRITYVTSFRCIIITTTR